MKTKKPAREKLLPSIHPGDVLMEEFMRPLSLTAYRVARDIGSTPITIGKIIRRQRAVSPEMALRLARYFRMTPEFWLGLQQAYDLEIAARAKSRAIDASITPCPALAAA